MRVFADFHHLSLYNSLSFLFEKRLGMQLYRPIGEEWHKEGFWHVFEHPETVKQYLSLEHGYKPIDGTPPLNELSESFDSGLFYLKNPEYGLDQKAITLDLFKSLEFDYVIASIPQHIIPFQRLISNFQPKAKLIIQVGNSWPIDLAGANLLCSVSPERMSCFSKCHSVSYRQEFDLEVFRPSQQPPENIISSYINDLYKSSSWNDFSFLESCTRELSRWYSYGGQCRDGCMTGAVNLSQSMAKSSLIYHSKPGGDGFGHIIHNAFAMGKPVITRFSHYKNELAETLFSDATCINLDTLSRGGAVDLIKYLLRNPEEVAHRGQLAYERFKQVVNFDEDEAKIRQWLENLR